MSIRRYAAIGTLSLGALLTTAVGAQAQTPPTYAGAADATALSLTLFGQEISAGNASAVVNSDPAAAAVGTGLLLAGATQGASSASVAGADGTDGSDVQTCTPEDVLETITGSVPINLDVGVGCSSSQAAIAGGFASATATGTVTGSSAQNPLTTLLTDLDDVEALLDMLGDEVSTAVVDPLIEAARLAQAAGLDIDLEPILDAVIDIIGLEDINLFNLTVGDTAASSVASAAGVVSTCSAAGAQLDILDLGPVLGGPQVSVIVGDSSAQVTATADGAAPVADARPSLVTVGGALVTGLTGGEPIEVVLGMPQELEIPGIGTLVISAASSVTGVDADGLSFATADGVRIELDSELLAGGIQLEIAACRAAATVAQNVTPVVDPPAPTTPAANPPAPELPRTGSDDTRTGVIALLAGAAGLGLITLRARRV